MLITFVVTGCESTRRPEVLNDIAEQKIKAIYANADWRNRVASAKFKINIENAIKTSTSGLKNANRSAARELATFDSCLRIVSLLAWDKVNQKRETDIFLLKKIDPIITPANLALEQPIEEAMVTFELDIRQSYTQLNIDLTKQEAFNNPEHSYVGKDLSSKISSNKDISNLPVELTKKTLDLALNTKRIFEFNKSATLPKEIQIVANRFFSKQIAKISISAALLVASSPIPLAEIIPIIRIGWNLYDIHVLQEQFEAQTNKILDQALVEEFATLRKLLRDHEEKVLSKYRDI
jgi:hypothetical protein